MGMELRISEIRNEKAKRAAYSIDNGDGVLKKEELSVFQQKAQELGVKNRVINNIMDYFNDESTEQAEPARGRQARREARTERREAAFDAVSEEAQRQRGAEAGARYTSDVMDATREALRADGLTRDERIALRAFEKSVVAADAGEVILDAIMLQGNTEIEGTTGNTQTVSGQDVVTDESLTNSRTIRKGAKAELKSNGNWEDSAVRHEWRTGGFVGSATRIQAAQNDVEQSVIQTTEEVMEELNTDEKMELLSSLNGKTVPKRDANGQPIEGETIQLAYKDENGNWHLDGLSQEIENVLGTDLQLNRDAKKDKLIAEFTVLQGRLSTLVGEDLSKEEVRELVRLCGFDIEPKDWQKILASTLTGGAIGAGAGAIGSKGDQLIVTADRLIDLENVVNLGDFGQVIQDLQIPIAGEVILIPGNVATATALGAVIPAIIGLLNGLKDDGQKPVIPTNFNATTPADLVAELKAQNNPYAEVMGVLAVAFRKEGEDGKMVWDREGFLHFLNSAAGDQNVLLNKEELIGALMKVQRGEYQVEEPESVEPEAPQEEVCGVEITAETTTEGVTEVLTYIHHRKGGDSWAGIVTAYYPELVEQYGLWGKDGAIKRLQKALATDENGVYNQETFRAIITATDLPKEMKLPSQIEGYQRVIGEVQAVKIQSGGTYIKALDSVGHDEYDIKQVPGQTTYIARDMCNNSTASGSTPQEAFQNLQDLNPDKSYRMN